ncbi:MAG: EF-P beta-lysylation protein EpmB [Planctomycetales bacterium]
MTASPPFSPSIPAPKATGWQRSLSDSIRDPETLLNLLQLPRDLLPAARRGGEQFPLFAPLSYCRRMTLGNPHDPLLRQVLPLHEETETHPDFTQDAVGDHASRIAPGLLHKYTGRALLIATGACAIHCRYCFRRHYPYQQEPHTLQAWQPAFDALAADPSLHEIILSGGDPLMLTDQRLSDMIARLETIPHLRRLRIHTRLPIVLPDRVTPRLVDLLRDSRLTPILVVHANHPQELQADCAEALRDLVRSGMTVLNQAVLLKGINDDLESLRDLSERLINLGVIPYYLHQLDRVAGTHHFEVDVESGRELVNQLRSLLPGYAVPQYVIERPGEPHKTPLM